MAKDSKTPADDDQDGATETTGESTTPASTPGSTSGASAKKDKPTAKKGKPDAKATKDSKDTAGTAKGDKPVKARPERRRGNRPEAIPGLNPTWWAPVMVGLMVVGLLWIVIFYMLTDNTEDSRPIPGIGYWNLGIGFGMIMAGFMMTTRWK